MRLFLIFCTVVAVCLSCTPKNSASKTIELIDKAEALAKDKLGDDSECLLNDPKTYLLCKTKISNVPQQQGPLTFFVYDLDRQQIVYEDTVARAEVRWTSDYEITIQEYPGLLKKDENLEDYTYTIDVIKKTKIDN